MSATVSYSSSDGDFAFGSPWLDVTTAHPDRLAAFEPIFTGITGPAGLSEEALTFARERAFQGLFNVTAPHDFEARDATWWRRTNKFTRARAGVPGSWDAHGWTLDGSTYPALVMHWVGAWAGISLGPGDYLIIALGHELPPGDVTLDRDDFVEA